MTITLKILGVICSIYVAFLPVAEAVAPAKVEVIEVVAETIEPHQLLEKYADLYGSDYNEMSKVIQCESNWRPNVYGDGGLAYSYAQFHKPTFEMWAKELNKDLSYSNPDDHLELMAYAFSKGNSYKRHWSCARILGIV